MEGACLSIGVQHYIILFPLYRETPTTDRTRTQHHWLSNAPLITNPIQGLCCHHRKSAFKISGSLLTGVFRAQNDGIPVGFGQIILSKYTTSVGIWKISVRSEISL